MIRKSPSHNFFPSSKTKSENTPEATGRHLPPPKFNLKAGGAGAKQEDAASSDLHPKFQGIPEIEEVMRDENIIALGDQNKAVTAIQEALVELGYLSSGKVSGELDAATETAIQRFQQTNPGLSAIGMVDFPTMQALNEALKNQ